MERSFVVTIRGNRVWTVVTRRARVVRQWLSRITNMNRYKSRRTSTFIVGLGVQWTPSLQSNNRVATLQLCVGSRCLIFQICRANSIPRILRDFLSNQRPRGYATFVGVRNYRDAELLYRGYELSVKPLLELGRVAGCDGYFSMESLARDVLGYDDDDDDDDGIEKEEWVGRSDWEQTELMDEQVRYACVDAYISFQLGKRFKAWQR